MVQAVKLPECSLSRFFFPFLVCFKIKIYGKKQNKKQNLKVVATVLSRGCCKCPAPHLPFIPLCSSLLYKSSFAFLRTPVSRDVMMGDDALPFITRQPTLHSPGYRGEDVRRLRVRVCLLAHLHPESVRKGVQ